MNSGYALLAVGVGLSSLALTFAKLPNNTLWVLFGYMALLACLQATALLRQFGINIRIVIQTRSA